MISLVSHVLAFTTPKSHKCPPSQMDTPFLRFLGEEEAIPNPRFPNSPPHKRRLAARWSSQIDQTPSERHCFPDHGLSDGVELPRSLTPPSVGWSDLSGISSVHPSTQSLSKRGKKGRKRERAGAALGTLHLHLHLASLCKNPRRCKSINTLSLPSVLPLMHEPLRSPGSQFPHSFLSRLSRTLPPSTSLPGNPFPVPHEFHFLAESCSVRSLPSISWNLVFFALLLRSVWNQL